MTSEVTVTPVTPEPEKLRAARDAYAQALAHAVASLTQDRVDRGDIATATDAPPKEVKRLLAEASPVA
ncbi:hypothetical protein [Streptomyces sp. TLI_146]|uniref:hypothetical protein n=1 Tax=Streptomyces sp. TLI_146 TaxID=1938858 RepID=UPI000C702B0C|nr:hypothetical protein [Streptomyces sp. TLI_146]